MALVNYDFDSSDEEVEDDFQSESNSKTSASKVDENKIKSNDELIVENDMFSRLPAPKASTSSRTSVTNTSLDDMVVDKSSSGPIKISVPSLKQYYEDDSDEELKTSKKFKKSSSGTGLTLILPKPKNTTSATSRTLMPHSITRPKPNIPPPKVLKYISNKQSVESKVKESSQQNVNYFFTDEKEDEIIIDNNLNNDLIANELEYGPARPSSNEINSYNQFSSSVETNPSNSVSSSTSSAELPVADDFTYKKFIASKFGEESADEINIIDVDVSKHLSDSKDWLKTISEEKEETYSGVQPTSTARRKHQITFLALQAKQREVELKNQWAQNRLTKNQARSKYGF